MYLNQQLKKAVFTTLPESFSDGRVTLAYGEYYLVVSKKVQPSKPDNQGRMVALDPQKRRVGLKQIRV